MSADRPSDKDARAERLAAALRENLRRRKAQRKARVSGDGEAADEAPGARPEADEGKPSGEH